MKKFLLITILAASSLPVAGQAKKALGISLGTGFFNSLYYTNAKNRSFYNFDFEYYIGKRHILTANFLKGNHLYYDSIHPNTPIPLNTPGYENHTNTEADYYTFSVLYKYSAFDWKKFSLNLGAGAGIMTQVILFAYAIPGGMDFRQASWSSLVFPTRIDLRYSFSKRLQVGAMGGLYFHPDYTVLGQHAGLTLGYVLP